MLPARKEEVFPVEVDFKKVEERFDKVDGRLDKCEERLGGLDVRVAVLTTQGAQLLADVAELRSDGKAFRQAMADANQALQNRMIDGFQSIQKEISNTKIWALLIDAAILGVMAKGFHWI
jgi:hypothetical protein